MRMPKRNKTISNTLFSHAPQGLASLGFVIGLMLGPNAGFPEAQTHSVTESVSEKKEVSQPSSAATPTKSAEELEKEKVLAIKKQADAKREELIQSIKECDQNLDQLQEARAQLGVHLNLFDKKDADTLVQKLEKAELAALLESLDQGEGGEEAERVVSTLEHYHDEESCKRNKGALVQLYVRAANRLSSSDSILPTGETEDTTEDADAVTERFSKTQNTLDRAAALPCLSSSKKREIRALSGRKDAEECIALSQIEGDWKAARKARKCMARIQKRDHRSLKSELKSANCHKNPYAQECSIISENYRKQQNFYSEMMRNAQQMKAHQHAVQMAMMRGGPMPQFPQAVPSAPGQVPYGSPPQAQSVFAPPAPQMIQPAPSAMGQMPSMMYQPQMAPVFMGY